MAFNSFDPLFGSMNQLSTARVQVLDTPDSEVNCSNNYEQECVEENTQELSRFVYNMTEDDVDRWRIEQSDKTQEELCGEIDCLVCEWGAPHGTDDLYRQILDLKDDNTVGTDKNLLYKMMSRRYKELIYDPLKKRKGNACRLPLLEPRHFRRHFERKGGCDDNLYKMAHDLAKRLHSRIAHKMDKGIRKDNKTGDEEICTADTSRAITNFMKLATFAVNGEARSASQTTVNVSSSGKRGRHTSVSISSLVGENKQEKRRKRLDTLTLSSYS